MSVSERDRRHFAAIAEAKRAERDERLREAAARDPMEKIIEGLALGAAAPTSEAIERMLDERALGQAELHRRARRLGLLR
jgi:hypothetical protein